MKITDIKTHLVMPLERLAWLFVEVETDEGITGIGECTNYSANPALIFGMESLIKPLVIGEDPWKIEKIWHRIFSTYSSSNGRGYISNLISGLDIALWDIKGKSLGVPIYELLGGPVRERVPLYTHVQDQTPHQAGSIKDGKTEFRTPTIEEMIDAAKDAKAAGYEAIKTDPFPSDDLEGDPTWTDGTITFEKVGIYESLNNKKIRQSVEWMEALREAVGPDFEILIDAHGRFDVPSAIKAANALEHINLVWFEEPCHAANHESLRQVRENTGVPLCVGERHFTRWDYTPLFHNRLVDYVMPDVAWCGGISEFRRISSLAETFYIPVSPHDALGPVAIGASFQLCMNITNLYRQECIHTWFSEFEKIITPMFDIQNGCIIPNGNPGIGFDLIPEALEEYKIKPEDNRSKPMWFTSSKDKI
ncbi:MAG: mandelate racemase [Chloroflexi bacterium]|nr:mandelate racemase [Chloroflexota bacterium]